jgi:nicotinamidase-related amidase
MSKTDRETLRPETTIHLCVDMQRMFAGSSPWAMPWMERTVPQIVRLLEAGLADRTVFTRFIPARNAETATGKWRAYYEAWPQMTLDQIEPREVELVEALQPFCPPGHVLDKHVYSPWVEAGLDGVLRHRGVDTIVITGGETDVCVLATVIGAIDHGYRTILVEDAVCSSADETHDAMMKIYRDRLGLQLEVWSVDEVIAGKASD